MIKSIQNRFIIEISHFRALPKNVRKLLISYTIFIATWPLFGTFVNTFLWRQSENINTLIIYNAGFFLGLPFGFIVNALLAKKIPLKSLYIASLIGQTIAPLSTLFFLPETLLHLGFNGLMFGLAGGVFWANKNFITLSLTKGTNRLYYTNMESMFDIIINTIVPFAMGWFLFFSQASTQSYQLVGLVAGLVLLISTYLSSQITFPTAFKTTILPGKTSSKWRLNRLFQIIYWSFDGLYFILPTALIMIVSNSEGIVGTFDSASAVISAILAYYVGRKLSNANMPWLFKFSTYLLVLGSVGLAWKISLPTILLYSLVSGGLSFVLRWNPYYTNLMDLMDAEKSDNYSLVLDNEIYFNLGRLFSVGVMFIVVYATSLETAIRYVPLALALLQLTTLPLIKKLTK